MQTWMSSSAGSSVPSWHMQHSNNPFGAVYSTATVATPPPPPAPGAVVLYNPLAGLPTALFGFGVTQRNPFAPGLSPLSLVRPPSYATSDQCKERFPASKDPNDPLAWISDDLFNISAFQADVQQKPMTSQ